MKNGNPGYSVHSHPQLSQPELRRVSVEAGCDPRTVVRYLRDGPVSSTAIPRIERALTTCGHARLVKPSRRDSNPPPAPASSR